MMAAHKRIYIILVFFLVVSVVLSVLIFFEIIPFSPNILDINKAEKEVPQTNQEELIPSSIPEEEITYPGYIRSPEPKAFVDDLAELIPDEKEKEIDDLLKSYEDKTTNVICILTVKSLGPEKIEDYTTRVFNEWHIGRHEEKNGILIVVSQGEIRIGIGSGFDNKLSSDSLKKILDESYTPNFRVNDISDAIIKVINDLIKLIDLTKNI